MQLFNPREATVDDVIKFLDNTGFRFGISEFDAARDNDWFKYIGFKNHQHCYLIGFEDDDTVDNNYVSIVFVGLDREGNLSADFGGCPVFESTDPDAIGEYIKQRCQV
jgi:hypothetical protein